MLLLGLILAAAAPPLFPGTAHACSCVAPPAPMVALGEAGMVFVGTVISIDGSRSGSDPLQVDFRAEENWKGQATAAVSVSTASNSAACGFEFEAGERYLVYADLQDGGKPTVSLCSRTTLAAQASADLADLGPGAVVRNGPIINEPRPFPTRMAILAVTLAVVVIGLGGALVYKRLDNNPDDIS